MTAGSKKQREQIRDTGRARRKQAQEQAARRRQYRCLGGVVAVIVVGALIGALILHFRNSGDIIAAAHPIDASIPQNGTVLGDPTAKVTLTEWGDFQCPFCKQFAENDQQQLIADYVKTGKIKYEFKNFPFNGAESTTAAEAAACAADQNRFWAMHDTIYANQGAENSGALSASRLEKIASVAGLDMTQYKSCMANNTHATDVANTKAEAQKIPIQSTPSFVLNGQVIQWSNYNDLKAALDKALAAAGG
jgi:protein-disulfide isomerase